MEIIKTCDYCKFQKREGFSWIETGTCNNCKSSYYSQITHYLDDCEQWEGEVEHERINK